jgi:hypothetical protein|tara:strand:+ start:394 stop:795 length:402 start_codon:yes stop_codon:yes gene_type:complete
MEDTATTTAIQPQLFRTMKRILESAKADYRNAWRFSEIGEMEAVSYPGEPDLDEGAELWFSINGQAMSQTVTVYITEVPHEHELYEILYVWDNAMRNGRPHGPVRLSEKHTLRFTDALCNVLDCCDLNATRDA